MSSEAQRAAWREAAKARRERLKKAAPTQRRGHKKMFDKKAKAPTQEAIAYLRHARRAMMIQISDGVNALDDPAYLFALLALRALEREE
jgi:hypothetical protein